MFNAIQLRDLMHAQPFKPFRILTSDGRSYDVPNHDMAMVGRDSVEIGLHPDAEGFAEYFTRVAIGHITAIEDLKAA